MKKLITCVLTIVTCTSVLAGCAAPASTNAEKAAAPEVGDAAKKVILVVSFGTSYNDTRDITIGAIEKQAAEQYPDYEVRGRLMENRVQSKGLRG
jgi:sirohydrochlorin cobaltochelatase